jgi:uncharacterized protein YecE (DUF72 family)
MAERSLAVGCAQWTHKAWPGRYWPERGRSDLSSYATWCNAVEGNTTFYALPSILSVQRWLAETPEGFRFCFKVPRTITHDRRLRDTSDLLGTFIARLAPLGERLGPLWIQLPPTFGPGDLGALDHFLAGVPHDFRWGVEVRNIAFEADGAAERQLHDLLHARDVDRVLIDTRAVFTGPRETPEEIEAWERKPRLRVRPVALGPHPMVRFIGRTDPDANPPWWGPWVDKVAAWIGEGREPLVFIHTPDNVVSPELCRRFHAEVGAAVDGLAPLPEPPPRDEQLGMF